MARYSRQGAVVVGVTTLILGFVVIGLGWVGAARTLFVPTQVAYAVSGGLSGIALIGTGATVLNAHMTRLGAAERAHQLDAVLDAAVETLSRVKRGRLTPPGASE